MLNELQEPRRFSINRIREGLLRFSPSDLAESGELANAAVALILRENGAGETEILMIRRAERPGDPWSGHMGFPGGKVEPVDVSPARAAVRETYEELGVQLDAVAEPIGRLSEVRARSAFQPVSLSIFPFLFKLARPVSLQLNEEVVEAVWIPLSFFVEPENRVEMEYPLTHGRAVLCCLFAGRIIWGMSLAMLDELVFEVGRLHEEGP